MRNIIRLKQVQRTNSKLFLVKLIKECGQLDLKESKEICDQLETGQTMQFEVRDISVVKKFRNEITTYGGEYLISGGADFVREFKMLELGLGEDSDYIKFIIEYFEVVKDKSKFFESILANLSREQIVSVFENLKEDYVSNMC